jgi:hypothetical protein
MPQVDGQGAVPIEVMVISLTRAFTPSLFAGEGGCGDRRYIGSRSMMERIELTTCGLPKKQLATTQFAGELGGDFE